jgi:hypothetical protein
VEKFCSHVLISHMPADRILHDSLLCPTRMQRRPPHVSCLRLLFNVLVASLYLEADSPISNFRTRHTVDKGVQLWGHCLTISFPWSGIVFKGTMCRNLSCKCEGMFMWIFNLFLLFLKEKKAREFQYCLRSKWGSLH